MRARKKKCVVNGQSFPSQGNVIDPLLDGVSLNIVLDEWVVIFPLYQGLECGVRFEMV
jgi:hypothetical protein